MRKGNLRTAGPAVAFVLAILGLLGCGSSGGDDPTTTPPPLTAATAAHLAKLSNRIATDIDAGETCTAAYAADDLARAVQEADLAASLRPGVEAVAGELVDTVNCPPPPPPPKEKKKPKDEEHGKPKDEHGNDVIPPELIPPGHTKHGGLVPPGQAKIGGEPE